MRVGIDFDNTIAGYDRLFHRIGLDAGWLPPGFAGTKKDVRAAMRDLDGGEEKWMRMQALAYGARMAEADLIEGVAPFLVACRTRGARVFVVSHKTPFAAAAPDGPNLREAALRWMDNRGFFRPDGIGLSPDIVFFESTRQEKCRRIADLGCTHFIDDLEEVFLEPSFPPTPERILLHTADGAPPVGPFVVHRSWASISHALFGAA